jgi:type II secretory pathway pseudopilin PulG
VDGIAKFRVQKGRGEEHGFTYIALLIFVAIMSVGLLATGEVWNTAMKREKEQELLFAGDQIRTAITMYYNHSAGQGGRFPMSLEDLLKDPRSPATKRYLRKLYLDPVTNSSDWELIKGPNGEIFGVHSASADEPTKKSNFSLADQDFEGKMKYSDWVFMISTKYVPVLSTGKTPAPSTGNISGATVPRGKL